MTAESVVKAVLTTVAVAGVIAILYIPAVVIYEKWPAVGVLVGLACCAITAYLRRKAVIRIRLRFVQWWDRSVPGRLKEFGLLMVIAIFLAGVLPSKQNPLLIVLGLPTSVMLARYWWKRYR